MRVSANGGTPELVIPANEGEQVDGPQLLPDGDSVLVYRHHGIGAYAMGRGPDCRAVASTGERKVVLQGGSDARYRADGPCSLRGRRTDCLRSRSTPTGWRSTGCRSLWSRESCGGQQQAVTSSSANYGISNDGTLVYAMGGNALLRPRQPGLG